jgi:hypothetical protein
MTSPPSPPPVRATRHADAALLHVVLDQPEGRCAGLGRAPRRPLAAAEWQSAGRIPTGRDGSEGRTGCPERGKPAWEDR